MAIHDYEMGLRIEIRSLDKYDLSVNHDYLLRFIDYLKAKGVSKSRITRYIYINHNCIDFLKKDFKELSKDDIIKLIGDVESRELSVETNI